MKKIMDRVHNCCALSECYQDQISSKSHHYHRCKNRHTNRHTANQLFNVDCRTSTIDHQLLKIDNDQMSANEQKEQLPTKGRQIHRQLISVLICCYFVVILLALPQCLIAIDHNVSHRNQLSSSGNFLTNINSLEQDPKAMHHVRCTENHMYIDIELPNEWKQRLDSNELTTKATIERMATILGAPNKIERPECGPRAIKNSLTGDYVLRFALPLNESHYFTCATSRVRSPKSQTFYYNRVALDSSLLPSLVKDNHTNNNEVEPITFLVACFAPSAPEAGASARGRHKRQTVPGSARRLTMPSTVNSGTNNELPEGFSENQLPSNFSEAPAELLDFSGSQNATGYGPRPILQAAIRQNGQIVSADTLASESLMADSTLPSSVNVHPGTPLEMLVFLDDKSAQVYGLAVSQLRVTDGRVGRLARQETIVSNGCSIDPYIFGNFELGDSSDQPVASSISGQQKSLVAKFRAFKFPDSHYVMFVGTVNVCINVCPNTDCGNGATGYGRRRRRRHALPLAAPEQKPTFSVDLVTMIRIAPESTTSLNSNSNSSLNSNSTIKQQLQLSSSRTARLSKRQDNVNSLVLSRATTLDMCSSFVTMAFVTFVHRLFMFHSL